MMMSGVSVARGALPGSSHSLPVRPTFALFPSWVLSLFFGHPLPAHLLLRSTMLCVIDYLSIVFVLYPISITKHGILHSDRQPERSSNPRQRKLKLMSRAHKIVTSLPELKKKKKKVSMNVRATRFASVLPRQRHSPQSPGR